MVKSLICMCDLSLLNVLVHGGNVHMIGWVACMIGWVACLMGWVAWVACVHGFVGDVGQSLE